MTIAFAEPRNVAGPEGAFFYHSIDLPRFGTINGDWDLRGDSRAYLGDVDFRGRRCLDMGAASGYLSFEMERLGATDVVSFDIAAGSDWDIVPHFKIQRELPDIRRRIEVSVERMKDAYWFCHEELGSRANAYYGDIYNLPEELGRFDVVFYGMILTHLRDPYWALYNGARLCDETLVVTGIWSADDRPLSTFRPAGERYGNLDVKSWWLLSRGTIENMIGTMGFEVDRIVDSSVLIRAAGREGPCTCQAIVARRVRD